jgi:16S rRNA (guanine527-N7)-methyltransferase
MLECMRPEDDVSRETLLRYEALVRKWNTTIQLVAPAELSRFRDRHISDSASLARVISEIGAGHLVDLGSGAGLPGIVVAIACPELKVSLIESDRRKAAFLRTVKRELNLANVEVHADRIEDVPPLNADVVTARALSSLVALLRLGARHGTLQTSYLFPKGRTWRDELPEAEREWAFELVVLDRAADSAGPILKITDLRSRETGNA